MERTIPREHGARLAVSMLKQTLQEWWEDGASRLAAALSYYTTFAIAPVLILVIAITGVVFGEEAAELHFDDLHRLARAVGETVHLADGDVAGLAGHELETFVAQGHSSDSHGDHPVLGTPAMPLQADLLAGMHPNALDLAAFACGDGFVPAPGPLESLEAVWRARLHAADSREGFRRELRQRYGSGTAALARHNRRMTGDLR